jgi:hypothetical protein
MIKEIRKYFSDVLSNLDTAVSTLCIISGKLSDLSKAVAANRSEQLEKIAANTLAIAEMQRAQLKQSHPHLVR